GGGSCVPFAAPPSAVLAVVLLAVVMLPCVGIVAACGLGRAPLDSPGSRRGGEHPTGRPPLCYQLRLHGTPRCRPGFQDGCWRGALTDSTSRNCSSSRPGETATSNPQAPAGPWRDSSGRSPRRANPGTT